MSNVILAFNRQDARLDLQVEQLTLPAPYRAKVDQHWQTINIDGRFFNGPVLTAVAVDPMGSPPTIALALTDYAHYLFAAQDPTREFDCRAAYCSAVLMTADQHVLLGKMSSHTSSPGQIQCPGGGIEIGADQRIDARLCCQRELEEEIGVSLSNETEWLRPLCIKAGGQLGTIGIFYAVQLKTNARDSLLMFDDHQAEQRAVGEKPEFDRLHSVKLEEKAIREFFASQHGTLVDYLGPLFRDHLDEVRQATEA